MGLHVVCLDAAPASRGYETGTFCERAGTRGHARLRPRSRPSRTSLSLFPSRSGGRARSVTGAEASSSMAGEKKGERSTMKVFVAGATGAVGNRLVPLLVASGHEVTTMMRSQEKAE